MDSESFKVSAPGKLMLLGEHAVLHGKQSIVCAVDRRISLEISPRDDKKIKIKSEGGDYSGNLDYLEVREPYRFTLTALNRLKAELTTGIDITVTSDIPAKFGLGCSAAATVATVGALFRLLGREIEPRAILNESLAVVQDVQGSGSGADIAASAYGGLLAYKINPIEITPLNSTYPLSVVYSGGKRLTASVIMHVAERREQFPEIFNSIYDAIGKCSERAIDEIKASQWQSVGQLLNVNQGLMDAIGVSDTTLSAIVYALRKQQGILGAKISGSGLGDSVIGLGTIENPNFPYTVMPIRMETKGFRIEV